MAETSQASSAARATLAAVILVAVASYPCVAQISGQGPPARPVRAEVARTASPPSRAAAGLAQPSAAADLCSLICRAYEKCFARADADCAERCVGELAICPGEALAQGRRCLVAPLRNCDREEIDECYEHLTIYCVLPALRDGGR